ncbi:PLC-like phosphodiesterase, TIM beta/alpha-barrel domain protein [Moelleriella libera RCEF 2490]|uniref:PLC-like phosphodiesterase, TIM beta/alpha-barrel domain protein n=1 Tax=Moelleriella libera RCEF 2490 TaxID=1081109 RepID=A0A167XVR9_9HYPO|nr:PLC-like phosphodiesterase, TIM beta/alpha-barrel domain protein [Moelleriella libera RCEF 2490]
MRLKSLLFVGLYAVHVLCASREYSFNAKAAKGNADWMAKLPDKVRLTDISIPGTHETMTYSIRGKLQCQNARLKTQLRAGIRYIDIRLRLVDNKLQVYHANTYTKHSFHEVLDTVFKFLDRHPKEALIMRIREEQEPKGKNTVSFETALRKALGSPAGQKHIWDYKPQDRLPRLGQMRSKVLILQNFLTDAQKKGGHKGKAPPEQPGNFGVAWKNKDRMALQDVYNVGKHNIIRTKWRITKEALRTALRAPHSDRRLFISHSSAAVTIKPITAARGPKGSRRKGMNELTTRWLTYKKKGKKPVGRVGVVVFDFPGKKAINAVIRRNKRLHRRDVPTLPAATTNKAAGSVAPSSPASTTASLESTTSSSTHALMTSRGSAAPSAQTSATDRNRALTLATATSSTSASAAPRSQSRAKPTSTPSSANQRPSPSTSDSRSAGRPGASLATGKPASNACSRRTFSGGLFLLGAIALFV